MKSIVSLLAIACIAAIGFTGCACPTAKKSCNSSTACCCPAAKSKCPAGGSTASCPMKKASQGANQ